MKRTLHGKLRSQVHPKGEETRLPLEGVERVTWIECCVRCFLRNGQGRRERNVLTLESLLTKNTENRHVKDTNRLKDYMTS